jgi:hypothetical protein
VGVRDEPGGAAADRAVLQGREAGVGVRGVGQAGLRAVDLRGQLSCR